MHPQKEMRRNHRSPLHHPGRDTNYLPYRGVNKLSPSTSLAVKLGNTISSVSSMSVRKHLKYMGKYLG